MSINTQTLEYDIHILINDNTMVCNPLNCSIDTRRISGLSNTEEKILNDTGLFIIEKYSDDSEHDPEINKETDLINSIPKDLCPTQKWLQTHMKDTIPHASFTIFINDKRPSYYPLCMATITKDIDEEEYYDEEEYETRYEYIKYLYINVFCGNSNYCRCASHLMNTIKMIALLLNYKYVVLHSINDKHTLTWYSLQGFKKMRSDNGSHYYIPNKKDLIYKRAEIEGACVIKKSRSNSKSRSRTKSESHNKKYNIQLSRMRKKINTKHYKTTRKNKK